LVLHIQVTGQITGAGEQDADGYIWARQTGINTRLGKKIIIRNFGIVYVSTNIITMQ
jgi:hypothetical protein